MYYSEKDWYWMPIRWLHAEVRMLARNRRSGNTVQYALQDSRSSACWTVSATYMDGQSATTKALFLIVRATNTTVVLQIYFCYAQ